VFIVDSLKNTTGKYIRRSKEVQSKFPRYARILKPRSRLERGTDVNLITAFEYKNSNYFGKLIKPKTKMLKIQGGRQ